jgi:hypothetical protein
MKNTLKFALTAVLLVAAPLASADVADCVKLSNAVKAAVTADSSKVLDIVATNIAANESCACEIVKAAIVASGADQKQVAKIVNTAILEAPSQIRLIAQCAIATAPDAVSNVQAILEKYDAAGGDEDSEEGGLDDSKDAKGSGETPQDGPNPLDYPFESLDDPIEKTGDWFPDFFFPPVETDPGVTEVDETALSV